MKDPRTDSDWPVMSHERRVETLLIAILEALVDSSHCIEALKEELEHVNRALR